MYKNNNELPLNVQYFTPFLTPFIISTLIYLLLLISIQSFVIPAKVRFLHPPWRTGDP